MGDVLITSPESDGIAKHFLFAHLQSLILADSVRYRIRQTVVHLTPGKQYLSLFTNTSMMIQQQRSRSTDHNMVSTSLESDRSHQYLVRTCCPASDYSLTTNDTGFDRTLPTRTLASKYILLILQDFHDDWPVKRIPERG